MNLFDVGSRSQTEAARPTESYFEFLNRVEGDFWQDVRNELERWHKGLPSSSHGAIRARMRGDEAGFWSAFWELLLHQLFVELGWRVEFEPDLEGGISPDLYISDSHNDYLVEATVLMEPESDARSELRRGPLMEGLSHVETRDFWLGLQIDTEGDSQPSGSRLSRKIQEWVDGLTYTPPQDQTTGKEPQDVFERAFADRGWHIRISALPKSQDHRRTTSGIQLGPMRGRSVDDHLAMTEDLKKKAQRYGSSQTPLILAVMNHRWTATHDSAPLALYGVAWEHPQMMAMGRIDPTWRNVPVGLWITRAGRRYSSVSAVITANHLAPHSFPDREIRVWHPPTPSGALETLPLIHMTPQPNGVLLEIEAARSIRDVFDLPTDWPTDEPFPKFAPD